MIKKKMPTHMASSYAHLLLSPSAPLLPFYHESLSPGTWIFSCLLWETAEDRAVHQSLGPSPKPSTKADPECLRDE